MTERRRNRSLALKLVLLVLTASTLVFGVIFWYNYRVSRDILKERVDENARNLALATVNRIQRVLSSIEKVPESMAYFLEHSTYSEEDIKNIIRSVIEKNPEIFGSTIAFEPYAFDKNKKFFAPYYYQSDGEIKFAYLGGGGYDYYYWDWYLVPKVLDRPVWSEPYFDEGGGKIIMSTYSVPFYHTVNGERRLLGIVTADISLAWLEEIVSSVRIFKSGYGFLISRNGTIVTHPLQNLIMNETIFSVAEMRHDPRLREIGRKMIRGETDFVPIDNIVSGKPSWLIYMPLTSIGWSLGVLYPQDELMADIYDLNRRVLLLGLSGFAVLLIIIILIARSIIKPLRLLAGAAGNIATGDLDRPIPEIKSRDEVGELADAFSHMRSSLKEYIHNLTETTAVKERIESELQIARDLQMGLLPSVFPPFPERDEFDIFATIRPAREVGGDLYDFCLIDENRLCFIIGDVSDKGVPAAFFMSAAKTLLKAYAEGATGPAEILTKVNRELSRDNDSCMFATLFCGVLDVRTGEVIYANGGHNPPLAVRRGGGATFVTGAKGIAAGAFEEAVYVDERLTLSPGDTLFLYTDGVTESLDTEEQLFSEERLQREIEGAGGKPLREMVGDVLKAIDEFSAGAPQADDITILALRFYGPGKGVAR